MPESINLSKNGQPLRSEMEEVDYGHCRRCSNGSNGGIVVTCEVFIHTKRAIKHRPITASLLPHQPLLFAT